MLTLQSNLTVDRKKVWTHTISTENAITENGMSHLLGGIRDVSETILNDPDQFPTSAAIKRYAGIKNGNNQKPLSLSELAALANEMAAQTSRAPGFAGFVGGPDQIAILANGKIQKLEQPTFPAPPRPMKFVLMADLEVTGRLNMVTSPDINLLWIRSNFVGIRNPRLRLDDQFFYGCEIQDSIVEYGGGFTDFGPTNKVIDTMLLPSSGGAGSSQQNFLQVANSFAWRVTPPEAPALTSAPTIGPRQPH